MNPAHSQKTNPELIASVKADLSSLSFCNYKSGKFKAWIETLPALRINQTSAILHKALPEISRLKTDAKTRFQLAEQARKLTLSCIQGEGVNKFV